MRWVLVHIIAAALLGGASTCSGASFLPDPATSYKPGVSFVELRDSPTIIRVGVSLSLLKTLTDSKLRELMAKQKIGFDLNFLEITPIDASGSVLRINIGANLKRSGIKVRCRTIRIDILFPSGRLTSTGLDQLSAEVQDTEVACSISGDIQSELAKLLIGDVDAIAKKYVDDLAAEVPSMFKKELDKSLNAIDDSLRPYLESMWVGVRVLPRFGESFLCLTIASTDPVLLVAREQLIEKAPTPLGPIQREADMRAQLAALETFLPFTHSRRNKKYRYPSALTQNLKSDEGDLALSGGLICIGGDARGCDLVQRSQDTRTGQIFRSPDSVGCLRKGEGDSVCREKYDANSQFSGDQLKGVAAYAIQTRDARTFEAWVRYIVSTVQPFPSAKYPGATGYKSCAVDQDLTCELSSDDWATIALIADFIGAQGLPTLPGKKLPYDWSPSILEWSAAATDVSYRLHLVAVQTLLMQRLEVRHPSVQRAAAILAARDRENPFYLYLHLGRDERVAQSVRDKCSLKTLQRITSRYSWTWQHKTSEMRWSKDPMVWDCSTMIRLLLDENVEPFSADDQPVPPLPLQAPRRQ